MRKFLCALLIFCIVTCLLPLSVYAADNTYNIDEPGIQITLPHDYVVFTRNLSADDPNLSTYGLVKDDFLSLMLDKSIYLDAWNTDVTYEIIVTSMDSYFEDYNLFSDTTLSALVSAMIPEFERTNITVLRSELYQHSQAKFVKLYISQPINGETLYGLEYHTVYNGKVVNVTMQSLLGEIGSAEEAILQSIVDSVVFDAEPLLPELPASTEAFLYTDKETGISFTVPDNWVETPMSKEREFLNVKFTSNIEEGLCILFASEDMLSDSFSESAGLSSAEKTLLSLSREELDNTVLTKADVAELWGSSEDDVSMVAYGGKEYFMVDVINSGEAYGLSVSMPSTYLIRIENGYMYFFQFNNSRNSPYFKDFEALIRSANYPIVQDVVSQEVRNQVFGSYVLLAIILLIVLLIVIVFICRFIFKKKKRKSAALPPFETMPPEVDKCPVLFCHRCGNKLTPGHSLCNICGTICPVIDETSK